MDERRGMVVTAGGREDGEVGFDLFSFDHFYHFNSCLYCENII